MPFSSIWNHVHSNHTHGSDQICGKFSIKLDIMHNIHLNLAQNRASVYPTHTRDSDKSLWWWFGANKAAPMHYQVQRQIALGAPLRTIIRYQPIPELWLTSLPIHAFRKLFWTSRSTEMHCWSSSLQFWWKRWCPCQLQGHPAVEKSRLACLLLKTPVPNALFLFVDHELKRLEFQGIYPMPLFEWASPNVVNKPNGRIGFCANFFIGLGAALDGDCYPPPLPEDILANLNGDTWFAMLDLSEPFFKIRISPESRKSLTNTTHRRLIKFPRLPWSKNYIGVSSSVLNTVLSSCFDYMTMSESTVNNLQGNLVTIVQPIGDSGPRLPRVPIIREQIN